MTVNSCCSLFYTLQIFTATALLLLAGFQVLSGHICHKLSLPNWYTLFNERKPGLTHVDAEKYPYQLCKIADQQNLLF